MSIAGGGPSPSARPASSKRGSWPCARTPSVHPLAIQGPCTRPCACRGGTSKDRVQPLPGPASAKEACREACDGLMHMLDELSHGGGGQACRYQAALPV